MNKYSRPFNLNPRDDIEATWDSQADDDPAYRDIAKYVTRKKDDTQPRRNMYQ